MELTNKKGIPESVFHWIKTLHGQNEVKRSESIAALELELGKKFPLKISATSLIKSTREVVLTDRHHDEMSREASDLYDSTIGMVLHDSYASLPSREGEFKEVRVGQEIQGVLVHGQFDSIYNLDLSDYKSLKVGGYIFGDKEYEYTSQLSIYRLLYFLHKAIMANEIGTIVQLFVDYRDREFETKKYGWGDAPNYPHKSMELKFHMWDRAKTEQWVIRKVTDYKCATLLPDNDLPLCKDEERWARENKKTHKKTYAKCDKYCSAKPFCNQAKGE
jgi:hypothetical protein